ncbi:MAG: Hsp20/alpha crystallin family protein [Oleiphilaceae bacterium]|nr:Hsp20/alpha crystallin family protein [Oleiphilaceae bacterium]
MPNISRWNPIAEFNDLLSRYNQHFGSPALPGESENRELFHRTDWIPAVDVRETAENYQIQADLPGMTKDDIKVTVENGVLNIEGERKKEEESGEGTQHRVERVYGRFVRRFTLPDNVDEESADAKFQNGILTLTLKKTEPSRPKAINVEVH